VSSHPLLALLGSSLLLAAAPLQETPEAAKPPQEAAKSTIERAGSFIPAHATEVKLGLESWSAPLEITEVVAHGAVVREGDVLARFDLKAIDDAITAAERDLRSTEVRHQNAREQARIDDEIAAQRLEAATDALTDAQEALDNFEKIELQLKRRGEALSEAFTKDGIDDQKDELAQLEKMYTADELTDATEEVVLRRSRRQINRSQTSAELQKARRDFDDSYNEKKQHEQKQKAVRDAQRNVDRTQRQIEMEKRTRADSLARLDPEMKDAREKVEKLKRDREKLVVKAPAAGVVVHGSVDDYRPGHTPPRHEIGGSAQPKSTLFAIAPPGQLKVALDVPEAQALVLSQGMAGKVVATADPSLTIVGRLTYDRFPSARSGAAPEGSFDGSVEIGPVAPAIVAGMRCKVVLEAAKK
jgi:multidrug resistance efflux pump